jgi:hypothetical protein
MWSPRRTAGARVSRRDGGARDRSLGDAVPATFARWSESPQQGARGDAEGLGCARSVPLAQDGQGAQHPAPRMRSRMNPMARAPVRTTSASHWLKYRILGQRERKGRPAGSDAPLGIRAPGDCSWLGKRSRGPGTPAAQPQEASETPEPRNVNLPLRTGRDGSGPRAT